MLSFVRYWNSRLATERQRLIDTFDEDDIVCKYIILLLSVHSQPSSLH